MKYPRASVHAPMCNFFRQPGRHVRVRMHAKAAARSVKSNDVTDYEIPKLPPPAFGWLVPDSWKRESRARRLYARFA